MKPLATFHNYSFLVQRLVRVQWTREIPRIHISSPVCHPLAFTSSASRESNLITLGVLPRDVLSKASHVIATPLSLSQPFRFYSRIAFGYICLSTGLHSRRNRETGRRCWRRSGTLGTRIKTGEGRRPLLGRVSRGKDRNCVPFERAIPVQGRVK